MPVANRSRLIAVALSLCVAGASAVVREAAASPNPDSKRHSGGAWALITRAAYTDLQKPNRVLAANGYSGFDRTEHLLGLSAEMFVNRVKVGAELSFDVSKQAAAALDQGTEAKLGHGALIASVGYHLLELDVLGVGPVFELGGTRTTIQLDPANPPFLVEPLAPFAGRSTLTRLALIAGIGVGADTLFPLNTATPVARRARVTREGIRVGIRASYWTDLSASDWKREGESLGKSPSIGLSGVHVRLSLGYGTDQRDSGACEHRCGHVDHATRLCRGDSCLYECFTGWGDCDGSPVNGCETRLDTLDNCGECAGVCRIDHGEATCASSSCEVASCAVGFANCDGFAITGCETSLDADVEHCGQCFSQCADGETCHSGICSPKLSAAAAPGFAQ